MKIRNVKNSDLESLGKIYADAFKNSVFNEKWKKKDAVDFISFMKNCQKPSIFHVAEEDGVILGGVVSSVKPWMGVMELVDSELFVSPKYQGMGVGKKLILEHLKAAKKKYNVVNHFAMTTTKEEFPLTWYRKIGYRKTKEYQLIEGKISEIINKLEY